MEFHVLVNWKLLLLKNKNFQTEISVSVFYIISFRGLGDKKKNNFQQKIDENFHFRSLGMTSVPDFRWIFPDGNFRSVKTEFCILGITVE